jgi:hypothetical protein
MGTGQTFDLLVHMVGGAVSEFKNISMAEAERLVAYMQGSRIRVGGGAGCWGCGWACLAGLSGWWCGPA